MSSGHTATTGEAASELSRTDRLRLDYDQTTDLMRTLTDVRFKLLALVPTLSGAAIALLGHPSSPQQLLAVGFIGLIATVGILLYELRNSQIYDYATRRAEQIERALGLVSFGETGTGGLFGERPDRSLRLFGVSTVDRDRGLALVYGAALAGWVYLAAWGALSALNVGSPRPIGAAIAGGIGLIVLVELVRIHESPRESAAVSASRSAV